MGEGTSDVAIIGGRIVGLASALGVTERHLTRRLVVLEMEARVVGHQTGHNSGVIHSRIYYRPGSYKARLCVEGARRMAAFCDAHGVRYEACGKVIVATRPEDLPRLQDLWKRGKANGVHGLEMVDARRVAKRGSRLEGARRVLMARGTERCGEPPGGHGTSAGRLLAQGPEHGFQQRRVGP